MIWPDGRASMKGAGYSLCTPPCMVFNGCGLSLISFPSCSCTTRSQRAATLGSWVTITKDFPAPTVHSNKVSSTSKPVVESNAPVGSSAKTTIAPVTWARAMATRCCCPPESWPMRRSSMPAKPRSAKAVAARSIAVPRGTPLIIKAMATFSWAVSSGISSPDWKTKPKDSRRNLVRALSLSPWMSTGARPGRFSMMLPASGSSMPASACSNVDLPEPEGPMMARDWPSVICRSTPFRAVVEPKAR